MARKKEKDIEVITFKMDKSLKKMMHGIHNRSQFIRSAILAALENVCPFCRGTGVLTPHRKKHWAKLVAQHKFSECGECHEDVLICKH